MVGEIFAGISAFNSMLNITKSLREIDDAVKRNAAVYDLGEQIIAAQQRYVAAMQQVDELKEQLRRFETWDREKSRYERREVSTGVIVFALKESERGTEPFHLVCPKCFHDSQTSELQATEELRRGRRVHVCPRCKSDYIIGAPVAQTPGSGRVISDYDIFTGKPE
jgi:hypothetical protein